MVLAGRYRLDREIGRGGMGVVWLGHDEVLGRQVALKQVAATSPLREARLAARLQHPHVVAVFDLVDDPVEGRWLVMEHVDGATLRDLVLREGPLDPDRAAVLLAQVAEGLAAVAGAGITHRDVKPSNVLVRAEDGVAKLSDFGIASSAAPDATVTQTGQLMGSPAYVAPEVAAGARADVAADVWSLGATACFALTGHPPYEGENALAVLYQVVHDDPPRPEQAGWLAPLIEHTLVKDPGERWPLDEVRAFLVGPALPGPAEPVEPTRVLTPLAPPRRWRPRPALVLVAAAVLVALGVGLYVALSGTPSTPSASSPPAKGSSDGPSTPTAAGMESFIRSYVAAVSTDPAQAWKMLTPRFQRASGGFTRYQAFWSGARNGRVLQITADPAHLTVSYQVHFDHFHNGPGPTVLELVHRDGHYLIDAENDQGFHSGG